MPQKQGGKGKASSQSDKNYWARAKLSGYAESHRARRIAREVSRQMKRRELTSPAEREKLTRSFESTPVFPKRPLPRPMTSVTFTDTVSPSTEIQHRGNASFAGLPLYQAYSAGVLLEQTFSLASAINALDNAGIHRQPIIRQYPTGRREIVR